MPIDPRRPDDRASSPPASELPPPQSPKGGGAAPPRGGIQLPLPVVAGALVVGLLAVYAVSRTLRPAPSDAGAAAARVDSAARADTALDIRWRSGRMDKDDCIGTFEVAHGAGTPARLIAFVMDSAGAIMGRDSAQVTATSPGVFVDFRFRRVRCDAIKDWQLQAATPKTGSN